MPSSPEIERILRAAELRVTRPRIAVLSAVHQQPHADTNAIIDHVRRQLGEVSHQAVYDVLQALTGAGLVRRIQPSGSLARYEARVADNHHHVVCRSCGTVADVDCAIGAAPCLVPFEDHGYVIDEAEVIYWGTCPQCQPATQHQQPATQHQQQATQHQQPATQHQQPATHHDQPLPHHESNRTPDRKEPPRV